jgi:hypothetical protein
MTKAQEFMKELNLLSRETNQDYRGTKITKKIKNDLRVKTQALIDKYYYNSFLKKRYRVTISIVGDELFINTIDPDTGLLVKYLDHSEEEGNDNEIDPDTRDLVKYLVKHFDKAIND